MDLDEEWKNIKGYEGRYEVSSQGRIRSLDFRDSWGRLRKGRTLKLAKDKRGYKRVRVSMDNKKKTFLVHRLVAIGFIPNIGNKETVNHKDGIKANNCISNLEWFTNLENIQHANAMGLIKHPFGKKSRGYNSPVKVFDLNNIYLYSLHGNAEMAAKGFDYRLVSMVTLGKRKSHKGHIFKRDKGE